MVANAAKVKKWNAVEMLLAPENRNVANKLGIYSVMMFVFPVVVFFFFNNIILKSNSDRLMWSGFASVLAVNIVIASYIVMAWKEDPPDFSRYSAKAKKTN
uniref:Vacuolar ATPase assembly integral membrane protein VMA21 homolog n=1 Tax=Fibrocapsa japonica TaxID=94617 RepID=A0A7S2XVQ8_9STRA